MTNDGKTRVISHKNMPMRAPYSFIALCWLVLDHFHIPSWGWGIAGTLAAILVFAFAYARLHEKTVDIMEHSEHCNCKGWNNK